MTLTSDFSPQWDEELKAAILRQAESIANDPQTHSVSGRKTPPRLIESILYSVIGPGKRIRPRLLMATAQAVNLPASAALPMALSLELFHCFSLIHDDLPCMDDDDMRRGRPSNHRVFGEAQALLAGDALMILSIQVFLETLEAGTPPLRATQAMQVLLRDMGIQGVLGGQAAEPELTPQSTLADLLAMHAMKTGALFDSAIRVPAVAAGLCPTSPQWKALCDFSSALGSAFQVADDISDASQDSGSPLTVLAHLSPQEAWRRSQAQLNSSVEALRLHFATEQISALLQITQDFKKGVPLDSHFVS